MDPQPPQVAAWLQQTIAGFLGVEASTVPTTAPLSSLGVTSIQGAQLADRLSTWLGRELPPTLIWEHPTVRELVAFLTTRSPVAARQRQRFAGAAPCDEPIALIGLACRFPGAPSADAFWRLLIEGRDAVSVVPSERWDISTFYDADREAPGKCVSREAGYIEGVDMFDAAFFGISPKEAVQMDPQQRLLLEVTLEALDEAGLPPKRLREARASVHVGAWKCDYADLHHGRVDTIEQHTSTGQSLSCLAGRVSYALGLFGPSITVNTACSSSLVAVHLACQSLRAGEAEVALVGGVNLLLTPNSTVEMSKFGGMSPEGRCKAFDADGNGYVRGEGVGVVVLKPLSKALRDGDSIHCVIRGSAISQGGDSNGLTAPSRRAQEQVLVEACAAAGVDPARVHYVEAHGTGTRLGDPIEASALGAVLGRDRSSDQPLIIGSVKTNIGHLESAAGIAGLIKLALSIRHGVVVPSLHFRTPNSNIDFERLKLRVPVKVEPWPSTDEVPLAGVSSFGFGGSNCHVVVSGLRVGDPRLFAAAESSPKALEARVRSALASLSTASLSEACAPQERTGLGPGEHRVAKVARTKQELRHQLEHWLGTPKSGGERHRANHPRRGKLVFVFSGQGTQWAGMGTDLLRDEPVFRAAILRCDELIRAQAGWSVLDELLAQPPVSQLMQVRVMWPSLFSLQIALAAFWEAKWGQAGRSTWSQHWGSGRGLRGWSTVPRGRRSRHLRSGRASRSVERQRRHGGGGAERRPGRGASQEGAAATVDRGRERAIQHGPRRAHSRARRARGAAPVGQNLRPPCADTGARALPVGGGLPRRPLPGAGRSDSSCAEPPVLLECHWSEAGRGRSRRAVLVRQPAEARSIRGGM